MRKLLKHILPLLLALLCAFSFTACQKQQEIDLTVPDQGTLTVGILIRGSVTSDTEIVQLAKKIFEEAHLGWKVDVQTIDVTATDSDDQITQLLNNLMVGKGPDVLIANLFLCNQTDVTKMCLAGAFDDLSAYFEKDTDWSFDGYNQNVIDSLKMDGKQYLMPLTYNLPLLITDETALQNSGIDLENCKTGLDLLQELNAYNERAEQDSSLPPVCDAGGYTFYQMLFDMMQMNPLNFDNGTVEWNENTQQLLETYQQFYAIDVGDKVINKKGDTSGKDNAEIVMDGDALFSGRIDYWDQQITTLFNLENTGKAAIVPIYNYDGTGISVELNQAAGITRNSENKAAAYEFVKALLSEKAQSQSWESSEGGFTLYHFVGCMPIREDGIRAMWETAVTECTDPVNVTLGNSLMQNEVRFEKAPDEILEQVIDLTHQITNCYIRNRSDGGNVSAYFADYFKGNESYDSAFQNADSKLKIYVTE